MPKITAIIPTFNEEAHINAALDSVSWADEIIVVDSFSTDRTPALVRENNRVRFVQHEYVNSATQKNWIIPQAKNEWIFLLDADERVTKALRSELQAFQGRNESIAESAYWISRKNFFLGQRLNHIWKGDAVIRLFHRDQCRYQDLAVHAEIETKGKIGRLKGSLEHHSFLTMERYLEKLERYAHWSARDYDKRTGRIGFYQLWLKPAYRFCKHYILELGFLDGKAGYTISKLMARGVRRRYEIIQSRRADHKDHGVATNARIQAEDNS